MSQPCLPYLSVVIPAYNEEERIAYTLQQVIGYLAARDYPWEVIVADDGSTDATAEIVERQGSGYSQVRLLSLPHGGKGWAVKNGMRAATGDYRLLCDADLSVPIQQVERLLPPSGPDADIAVGSREALGAARYGEPSRRHFMGRVYNSLVRRLAVPGLEDTQCGFKCFKRGPAHRSVRPADHGRVRLRRRTFILGAPTGVDHPGNRGGLVLPGEEQSPAPAGLTDDGPGPAADQVATPESLSYRHRRRTIRRIPIFGCYGPSAGFEAGPTARSQRACGAGGKCKIYADIWY